MSRHLHVTNSRFFLFYSRILHGYRSFSFFPLRGGLHKFLFLTTHDFFLGDTTTTFWKQGTTQYCYSRWDFLIAGDCACNGKAKCLKLNFQNSTTIKFTGWTTTATWKTWCPYVRRMWGVIFVKEK